MHTEKYLHGLYGGLGLNGLSVHENKSLQNDIYKHTLNDTTVFMIV
jgi:hypothetical protein